MVNYAPLEGRGWQPLPIFLAKKTAIINIHNDYERCFGYALLYFFDRQVNAHRHANRTNPYSKEIFKWNSLLNLPDPIAPTDFYLFKDQLQVNINLF